MRSAWSRWLLVIALAFSIGAHWALLQSVAWVGMVAAYSREGSFAEAVSKSFDGKHPCCLCKMIQKGREAERKSQPQQVQPGSTQDVGIPWRAVVFDFHHDSEFIAPVDSHAAVRFEEPPKPRPRNSSADGLA